MDKKELQNLIDRISLTGPEGIKKIKKVLKELNDGSGGSPSGSMSSDDELVIAQALNELNGRIIALESAPTATAVSHTLTVLSFSSDEESAADVLNRLLLDGNTPTIEDLQNIDLQNTIVSSSVDEQHVYEYVPSYKNISVADNYVKMHAGYYSASNGAEDGILICIDSDYSFVYHLS